MKRWFARLPFHAKLVVMALVVTTAALVLATAGLMALDLWRYRTTAEDDIASLAQVIAENTAAAVTFKDLEAARTTLATVRVRPTVHRACLYLPDGTLFAGFARSPELACPESRPSPASWRTVAGTADVTSNARVIGTVYIERDLAEIGTRIAVAGLTGLGMLLVAGTVAFALAYRLHRSVSTPITQLASAVRALEPDGHTFTLPATDAGEDEVGDLVRAFSEMLRRVQEANARLLESNEVLRRQEGEREQLLAREREASRLKDEFLAAVSHELRTPLNAIVGWVQILTTTAINEQTMARAIASIARNARIQTRVIEDLVDVSRIVTGKLHIRFDPIDLREVAEGAVEAIRAAAQAKEIRLSLGLPGEVCFVNGDRDRLQQVVWNLLSNAIKFTPQGGAVFLTLRADGNAFTLDVADTGIGISPSFLPHVFDRFRQADGSTTREHGGLGLGLAIVKELTELHGGSVTAASAGPDLGATFSVRLPRLAGLHAPEAAPGARDRTAPATLSGVHILAVDDNFDALEVLESALAGSGARVRTASRGDEALREWKREPADVLICDVAMPHVSGFDVVRGIREHDKATGHVTCAIALTAHASPEYEARTREAGFDWHISKPFDSDALIRAIVAVRRRT